MIQRDFRLRTQKFGRVRIYNRASSSIFHGRWTSFRPVFYNSSKGFMGAVMKPEGN